MEESDGESVGGSKQAEFEGGSAEVPRVTMPRKHPSRIAANEGGDLTGGGGNDTNVKRTEKSVAPVLEVKCFKCGQLGHRKQMYPQL